MQDIGESIFFRFNFRLNKKGIRQTEYGERKKSHIQETLNLSTDADSITISRNFFPFCVGQIFFLVQNFFGCLGKRNTLNLKKKKIRNKSRAQIADRKKLNCNVLSFVQKQQSDSQNMQTVHKVSSYTES